MAGQNNFLPGPSGSFYSYLTSNEECERGFYPNLYEPYPGCSSGYWQHEQVAFGRESSVGARMEQSPSTANKEARWVCDWRMCQSTKFWLKHLGLMRPPPKFGTCKILANFFLTKNCKKFDFALVRPGPYYKIQWKSSLLLNSGSRSRFLNW